MTIDYRKIPHTFKYYRQCLMVADFISQDEKVCRYPKGLPLVALLFVRRLLAESMVKMNHTRAWLDSVFISNMGSISERLSWHCSTRGSRICINMYQMQLKVRIQSFPSLMSYRISFLVLWVVTPVDLRPVNWPITKTPYSPKSKQIH